jgi:hypothetical protein
LQSNPAYAPTLAQHQSELTEDAALAITNLLQAPALPDVQVETGRKLLQNVEKTKDWGLPPERLLLLAKLKMPEAVARGAGVEASQAYLDAVHAKPAFAEQLKPELDSMIRRLLEYLHAGGLAEEDKLAASLQNILIIQGETQGIETIHLLGELFAREAQHSGNPIQGLRILLQAVEQDPALAGALRPQAKEIVGLVNRLPLPDLINLIDLKTELRTAGDIWKLPEPYMVLANLEPDQTAKLDDYKMADSFGSMTARALVGRTLLAQGAKNHQPELAQQGAAKLREAVAAGDTEAMMQLGQALCDGDGIPEDAQEAFKLATMAQEKGQEDAFYLAARARLRLAEISRDPAQYAQASELLEKAVEKNLPRATYFLFIANYNHTVKNPDRALAALQKGEAARDSNCLYYLGIWSFTGQPPLTLNVTRGRSLIEQAASMGNGAAVEWLKAHPK